MKFMRFLSKKTSQSFSKYRKFIESRLGKEGFNDCIEFLEKNNLARPIESASIHVRGSEVSLDFFLGRSRKNEEDLIKVNEAYEGRVPEFYLAICVVNEVDFACLGRDSKIYLWDHERNDLYFDAISPNNYKKQDSNLELIFRSFSEFIEEIHPISEPSSDDDAVEDEYNNPDVAYPDDALDFFIKYPSLFFKQTPEATEKKLKKLKLSKKGNQLLDIFREKNLISP